MGWESMTWRIYYRSLGHAPRQTHRSGRSVIGDFMRAGRVTSFGM
jgi:hypothetical protein